MVFLVSNRFAVLFLAALLTLTGLAAATATRQQAEAAISAADFAIYTADQAGKDVTAATAKLSEAVSKLSSGDYDSVVSLANNAKSLAETALPKAGSTPPSGGTTPPSGGSDTGGDIVPDETAGGTEPVISPENPSATHQPSSAASSGPLGVSWFWFAAAFVILMGFFIAFVAGVWLATRKRY